MKTYMTETALGLIAATLIGSAAFAFPAHQKDGYRDTGCDEAQRVEIRNEAGELLYTNNPSCPNVGGAALDLVSLQSAFPPAPVKPAPAKK